MLLFYSMVLGFTLLVKDQSESLYNPSVMLDISH